MNNNPVKMTSKKELINECLNTTGHISNCFSLFHNYSFSNMLWVCSQMRAMNIPITPIKTLNQWNNVDRRVNKGAKGLYVNEIRIYKDKNDLDEQGNPREKAYYKITKNHFAMAQTTGKDYSEDLKEYKNLNIENILKNLKIEKVDFNMFNGNVQGYASKRAIAINPLDKDCLQTLLHEVAHIVLEHNKSDMKHAMCEVEAEMCNYIICAMLDKKQNLSSSRAYVQGYLKQLKLKDIPENNCNRIFDAVDNIIKASKNKYKYKIEK